MLLKKSILFFDIQKLLKDKLIDRLDMHILNLNNTNIC